jgi:hypothetical protein
VGRSLWIGAVLGLIALVVGVGVVSALSSGKGASTSVSATGDDALPSYAHNSPKVLAAYQAAVANADLFEEMPCYCGCAFGADPHHNLRDCFIDEDGGFDQHASACATCVNIASDVTSMQNQGTSPRAIRQVIDATYGSFGPSTDTPPVSD